MCTVICLQIYIGSCYRCCSCTWSRLCVCIRATDCLRTHFWSDLSRIEWDVKFCSLTHPHRETQTDKYRAIWTAIFQIVVQFHLPAQNAVWCSWTMTRKTLTVTRFTLPRWVINEVVLVAWINAVITLLIINTFDTDAGCWTIATYAFMVTWIACLHTT